MALIILKYSSGMRNRKILQPFSPTMEKEMKNAIIIIFVAIR